MTLDLSINLGQVISAGTFVVTVIWAHQQMRARIELFFETLNRHEKRLESHEDRLQDHGERLAALAPDRRR